MRETSGRTHTPDACMGCTPGWYAWEACLPGMPGRYASEACLRGTPRRHIWEACLEGMPRNMPMAKNASHLTRRDTQSSLALLLLSASARFMHVWLWPSCRILAVSSHTSHKYMPQCESGRRNELIATQVGSNCLRSFTRRPRTWSFLFAFVRACPTWLAARVFCSRVLLFGKVGLLD